MSDTIYPGEEEEDLARLATVQGNREMDSEYWVGAMSRRIIDLNYRITKLENILNSRLKTHLEGFESRMVQNQNSMFEWLKKELEDSKSKQ